MCAQSGEYSLAGERVGGEESGSEQQNASAVVGPLLVPFLVSRLLKKKIYLELQRVVWWMSFQNVRVQQRVCEEKTKEVQFLESKSPFSCS